MTGVWLKYIVGWSLICIFMLKRVLVAVLVGQIKNSFITENPNYIFQLSYYIGLTTGYECF